MERALTPTERLISNKNRIKFECKVHEERLNENLQYLQKNSGKLIISGVTSAVFPGLKSSGKQMSRPSSLPSTLTDLALGGVSTYLTAGKGILPLAVNLAKPLLLTWGIKGAKKLLKSIFTRKGK